MKKLKRSISLVVILVILIPFLVGPFQQFGDFSFKSPDDDLSGADAYLGNGNMTMYNQSILECADLQESIYYNFSADLIDDTNASRIYDGGYLETQLKDTTWFTPWYDNFTSIELNNSLALTAAFADFYNKSGYTYELVAGSLDEAGDDLYSAFNSTFGYNYPATYTFQNDAHGTDPWDWSVSEAGTCTANVIDFLGDHRKVLELYDGDANIISASHVFSQAQTSGTIEFWIRTDDVTQETYIALMDGGVGGVIGINLRVETANFQEESAGWADIAVAAANTWYHFRIDFNCGTYGLEGLAADTYHIYIDNIYIGTYSFANAIADIDTIRLYSDAGDAIYYSYFDAFGFGWNDSYDVGDNIHWNYYPATNDFESHNITHSGNYYGTYSFEEDAVGASGVAIDFIDVDGSDANCDAEIEANIGGHKKVLELYDNNGAGRCYFDNLLDYYPTSGTVEFWIRTTDVSKMTRFIMWNQVGGVSIDFRIDTSNFLHYDGADNDFNGVPVSNIWYHIRIDFECGAGEYTNLSSDDFKIAINDIEYGPYNFVAVATTINKISLLSDGVDAGYYSYYDSISYSWDTNYCEIERTWNQGNDYKSWNKNSHNITSLLNDNWDYYGTLGTTYSTNGEFGVHKKFLQIYDDSDTDFYRATYSFEDDLNDVAGTNIEFVDQSSGTVDIANVFSGHNKVIKLEDGVSDFNHTFSSAQYTGAIEFWMASSETSYTTIIYIYDEGENIAFAVRIDSDNFQHYDNGGWSGNDRVAADDTWYHIRFIFNCFTDTYSYYVDHAIEASGTMAGTPTTLNKIHGINTTATPPSQDVIPDGDQAPSMWQENPAGAQWSTIDEYIPPDILDYIWATNVENDFMSGFTMTTLVGVGAGSIDSIDVYIYASAIVGAGSPEVNMLFPAAVWQGWQDDFGVGASNWYSSTFGPGLAGGQVDLDGLIVSLRADTPAGLNYVHSMYARINFGAAIYDSYFDAFGFSWDENYITSNYGSDNGVDIGGQIWNNFDSNKTSGTISFWMDGDMDKYIRVYLMQDYNFVSSIKINASSLYYLNNQTWVKNDTITNAWHYFRITFDTNTDTYDLWHDNNPVLRNNTELILDLNWIASDIPFQRDVSGVDRIMFEIIFDASATTNKIDVLEYSWENSDLDYNLVPNIYTELEFNVTIDMNDYSYILTCLFFAFLTTSNEYVNFSWYNYAFDRWDDIASGYYEDAAFPYIFTEMFNCSGSFNFTFFDAYINPLNNRILFNFHIIDFFDEFDFFLDELRILMRNYVHVDVLKIFCFKGIWRYRMWLFEDPLGEGVTMFTNWTYFEVIPLFGCENFEGISESPYTTYWELIGSGVTAVSRFSDDLSAGTWNIYGPAVDSFNASSTGSYLVDNTTVSDEWDYTEFSFDVGGQETLPSGICYDGTYIYIVGTINARVFRYTTAGEYLGPVFWTVAQTSDPHDICWDGTFFWVLTGFSEYEVYKYNAAGVYQGFSFDVSGRDTQMTGICWDGTFFYISGSQNDNVYKYNAAGVYQGFFDVSSQTTTVSGICFDGTHLWVGGDEKYQYTIGGIYTHVHFHTATEQAYRNFAYDGTYFWILSVSTTSVYQYENLIDISKIYHGGGLVYMQTNMTESITLTQTYGTSTTAYSGDSISLIIQATAEDIDLNLYLGGVLQDSFTVLSGNIDAGIQTVRINLDADITFDQIEFEGVSITGEYFICYNIEFEGYDATAIVYDMYIDPDGKDSLMCQVGDYVLNIYDEVTEEKTMTFVDSRNITLDYNLLTEIYIPTRKWNLKIYHYATEISDIEYSGPETNYFWNSTTAGYNEILEFYWQEGEYQINWTNGENGVETSYNITLTYDRSLILDTTYYSVWFRLFDQYYKKLDDTLFSLYINNSLQDFGLVLLKSDDTLITVYDQLNVTVYNQIHSLINNNEFNIYITVFELEIRHLATENSNVSISECTTHNFFNFSMSAFSSRRFILAQSTYNVTWINGENNIGSVYDINLDLNYILTLNTSYSRIYFGLFTYDGLGIDHNLVRFYIDGARKDFGFNVIQSTTVNLTVLDYFNNTLSTEIIDVDAYDNSEYNIFVEIYTMFILNRYTYQDLVFNITQVGSGVYMNQIIPASFALQYRFLPNVTYTLNATYVNGTVCDIRTVNLTSNSHLESFGVPTNDNEFPKDVYFGIYTGTGLGVDHDLLKFYINSNRTDFGFNRIQNEIVHLVVQDYFNSTLFNQYINVSGIFEFDIYVTLYSLKIKNEAREYVDYTLAVSANLTSGNILPEEIIEYQLATNTYIFTYTNHENGISYSYSIILNQNRIHIINSTYYTVYFSLWNQGGMRLDDSLFSLYINGTIKDFGFIELESNETLILVQDYLNVTVFNNAVMTYTYSEYNIYITVFELEIRHLAQVSSNISLSECITHNFFTFSMSPDSSRIFKLAQSLYNVSWTNGENGLTTIYDINLDMNYILMLNTTYYNIYFSLFDLNLHTIDPQQYIFRLNGTIQDLGLIGDLQSDDYTITVVDRFGISLFNNVVALRGLNEYRIDITLYELQIRHLATENSDLILTEDITLNTYAFIMTPDSIKSVIVGSADYTLSWTNGENGLITLISIVLTADRVIMLNTTYYNVYFSLYDQGGLRLDDSLFSLYINRTRKDFGFVVLESDDTRILVQDYLNVTVFNQVIALRIYFEYNINITVFELQIRHLARVSGNVSLSECTSHNFFNFSMSPDSSRTFKLAQSTYNVTWINGENMIASVYDINLDINYILTLNTTYYTVHFAAFSFDGIGISKDFIRFYVNGNRRDVGPVELSQNLNTLLILDFFSYILYYQVVNLSGYTEWSMFCPVYTLIIMNNYTYPIKLVIGRLGGLHNITAEISSFTGISYRFLCNVSYRMHAYYIGNETLLDSKTVKLSKNGLIVSFGFFEIELPAEPVPVSDISENILYLVMIITVLIIVIAVIYFFIKKKSDPVPSHIRKRYKIESKKSPGTWNNKIFSKRET